MTKIEKIQNNRQTVRKIASSLFKDDKGEPYILADGQCDIFIAVTDPTFEWVWLSAPTRYGKSEVLALALLYLATSHKLKIPIVAGSTEKANKIMEYIITHISDHPSLYDGLINLDSFEKVDRLKVAASKTTLRWGHGGWIYITSVDARSISKEGESVVGEGGDIVVLEEAGLIKRKEQFSKIIRMVEGDWGKMIMSGNCIEKSVFEDGFNNPLYYKVRVGLQQAIDEGRINPKRLEQQKTQTTTKDWKRYYLVEFPKASEFAFFKPKKYDILPPAPGMNYYGGVDLALGESEKGSKVGIIVLGRDRATGQIYEIDSIIEVLSPNATIRTIFNLNYQFHRMGIESVAFQKYFLTVITEKSKQENRYIPFEGITQTRQKMERIESIEPFINTGQILFKGDNQLWEDMMEFPDCEFLDGLDALEMAWRVTSDRNKVVVVKSRGK